jgi:hypothetical protein
VVTVNWELIAKAGHHSIAVRIQDVFFAYGWNCNPLQIVGLHLAWLVFSISPKVVYRGVDTVAWGSQTYRILVVIVKICCGCFRTGFRSSYRRRYCGFLSWDLRNFLHSNIANNYGVCCLLSCCGEGWPVFSATRGTYSHVIVHHSYQPPHRAACAVNLYRSEWLTIVPLHFRFNLLVLSPSFAKMLETSGPTFNGHHHPKVPPSPPPPLPFLVVTVIVGLGFCTVWRLCFLTFQEH